MIISRSFGIFYIDNYVICKQRQLSVFLQNLYTLYLIFLPFCIGDHSVWCGPSSHLERPVESEVRHTGPTPMDRLSNGDSGLHYTYTAMRLAFAKTPPPWIEAASAYCISLK